MKMPPPAVQLLGWSEGDFPLLVRPSAPEMTCRRVGFELLGETDFEDPRGHWMGRSDWLMSLAQ